MNVNWEKTKYEFLEFINKSKIKNFNDFYKSMKLLDNDVKGMYFEYFCKLYFCLETISKTKYKEFYLYTEVPLKLKNKIRLPQKDKGIDCIVIDNDDNILAIQVKFRYKT
jgi:predicted helicase